MLSRLASYLLGGAGSEADEAEAAAAGGAPAPPRDEAGATTADAGSSPVEARLRQVEVEGDDWILIDRNVEAYSGMDESWYVTPPACFTQSGPVHLETSPLEDLLIEHPSMSVYRAAGSPPPEKKKVHHQEAGKAQRPAKRRAPPVPEPKKPATASNASSRLPMRSVASGAQQAVRSPLVEQQQQQQQQQVVVARGNQAKARPSHQHHHHHHHHHHQQQQQAQAAGGATAVAEQGPRRSSMRDPRNARGDENVRIVQIRSAQKMLEKRASQATKRNRLERSNKVREVASGKGRRPRRQDRLRLNNSGANNNRKC